MNKDQQYLDSIEQSAGKVHISFSEFSKYLMQSMSNDTKPTKGSNAPGVNS